MKRVIGLSFFIFTAIFFIPSTYAVYKDIVLLIDTSSSVSQSDLIEAVDFVYNVTQWLNIGTNDIQMSVITFASDVTQQFDLNDYTVNSTLLNAIEDLKSISPGGSTYTFDALMYTRTTSFLSSKGGRSGAEKAVLVMTDGHSTNFPQTVQEASRLRTSLSSEIFAIGIGAATGDNQEIKGIASDPDSYYVYYVDSFDYLCSLVPSIVPKLDPDADVSGIATCPTVTTIYRSTTESVAAVTLEASSNLPLIIGILCMIVLLVLLVTIATAYLMEKKGGLPKVASLEQQIVNAVNQYSIPPVGQDIIRFDPSVLGAVPNFGPRIMLLDVLSPQELNLSI